VAIVVRLGDAADIDAAVSVYERSALARREGVWPQRASWIEGARSKLQAPETWFLVAVDGAVSVGMALTEPARGEGGAGPVIPGACFLNLLFVVPERWGEGIGGALLDVVLTEAKRRGYSRIDLWTHEENERSHRLYRARGFVRTGRVVEGEGEWTRQI
jgi:GNAT superfamily N-acetyltransferase